MLVKELFQSLNRDDIVDAYMFRYGLRADSIEASGHTLEENMRAVRRERRMVFDLVDRICQMDTSNEFSDDILFVIPYKDSYWEDRGKTVFDAHVVHKSEALSKIKSSDWVDDGDDRVEGYAFEFCPTEEIISYTVSEACLKKVNHLDITTEVLSELSFFGYETESRDSRVVDEMEEIGRRVDDMDARLACGEEAGIPAEQVFAELDKHFLDSCETDEEREHLLLEREFDDKVRDIEYRYAMRFVEINRKITEDFYKSEFLPGYDVKGD